MALDAIMSIYLKNPAFDNTVQNLHELAKCSIKDADIQILNVIAEKMVQAHALLQDHRLSTKLLGVLEVLHSTIAVHLPSLSKAPNRGHNGLHIMCMNLI
jgi:hypothetical protein